MKLADLLKPEGHVKQDAKGICYLVEERNTSFDFTYVHRVRAVGQFEMNNRPQNTKPPLSNGERRFCVGGRWRLHGGGALPQRRGAALARRFNVMGPNGAGKPAWRRRRQ